MSPIVSIVLAIICVIVALVLLYIFVLPQSKDGQLGGFLQFLHDFLNMKKLYLEAVMKFFYVLTTLECIFLGFFLLFAEDLSLVGLALLILGPIVYRLAYEFIMLAILLVKNVIDINNTLNKNGGNIGFASNNSLTEKFSQTATNYAHAVSAANAQIKAQQTAQQAAAPQAVASQTAAVNPAVKASKEPEQQVCPACGNILPAEAKFCNKCGQKL